MTESTFFTVVFHKKKVDVLAVMDTVVEASLFVMGYVSGVNAGKKPKADDKGESQFGIDVDWIVLDKAHKVIDSNAINMGVETMRTKAVLAVKESYLPSKEGEDVCKCDAPETSNLN